MTLNQHPDTHKLLNPSAVGLPTATYGKLMMLKRIISFILLILSITACSSGYSDEEVNERFGTLLEAFDYGAPPHGGIAPGIDRLVMLLAGEKTIREVITFPKNQSAVDLTFNAPSPVSEQQLAELHLRLRKE